MPSVICIRPQFTRGLRNRAIIGQCQQASQCSAHAEPHYVLQVSNIQHQE